MSKRIAASLMLVYALGVSAARAEAWEKMIYSDPRHPSAFSSIVMPLWQRELSGKPFYQLHAARFEVGGATYLVSLAFAGGICTMGANGRNAVAEPAICPARIDIIQDGRTVQTVRSKVCSVAPLPEDTTANPTDATEVAFDAATQTVRFRSRLSGRWLRACQRQVRFR